MSLELRIVLLLGSILMLVYMVKKVKKSKIQIEYTVFWIVFGIFLILIGAVPQIVYIAARVLKVESPANLVLAFIILVLALKIFLMTIEMSQLEIKVKELVEEIALKNDAESLDGKEKK